MSLGVAFGAGFGALVAGAARRSFWAIKVPMGSSLMLGLGCLGAGAGVGVGAGALVTRCSGVLGCVLGAGVGATGLSIAVDSAILIGVCGCGSTSTLRVVGVTVC